MKHLAAWFCKFFCKPKELSRSEIDEMLKAKILKYEGIKL